MTYLKTTLLAVGIGLLVLSHGNAQDQAIVDSLLLELSAAEEDSLKADILLNLGDQYRYNQPDTALMYFQEALKISEEIDSPTYLGYSIRNIGMLKESQGLHDEALEEYFKALAIYEEAGNKRGIAQCYNSIAIVHYLQESPELCMEYLTKSFEIKKELGDLSGMSNYYINMSA